MGTASQMFGRWSAEEVRAAADVAREKSVTIHLGADGSISIGESAVAMQAADQPEREPQAIPAVFSPASLAERWNCSERHIRNLMRTNRLPYFRLSGKLMRIRGGEVERIERLAEPGLPATHLPSLQPRRQAGAKVPEEMRAKIALAAALKAARDLREKPKKTGR